MTLEIITSDNLSPLRHGFFTRRGGVSAGVYTGLNCGPGSDDQREMVAINRALVANAMQVPADALLTLHQVHSADVVHVTDIPHGPRARADAFVTATPGLAISALSADCQPVLFADAKAGVIGAAHAGWKGALGGVLEATIDAMETLGAKRKDITATIGPCISQAAYEVGPEFRATFEAVNPHHARFFRQGTGDKQMFDLPGFGLHRLKSAGIGHAAWSGHCTYADADRFYSYRRTTHAKEADYGRLIATIRL